MRSDESCDLASLRSHVLLLELHACSIVHSIISVYQRQTGYSSILTCTDSTQVSCEVKCLACVPRFYQSSAPMLTFTFFTIATIDINFGFLLFATTAIVTTVSRYFLTMYRYKLQRRRCWTSHEHSVHSVHSVHSPSNTSHRTANLARPYQKRQR